MLTTERTNPGFPFHIGVIESNVTDPLFLNRHKVRVHGIHSDIIDELPTEDLPWGIPISFGGSSWTGESAPNYVNGTWVIVSFSDDTMQECWIIGSVPGWPQKGPSSGDSFNDPDGVYPKYPGKQDTHPHTRIESSTYEDTDVLKDRKSNIDSVANEPVTEFAPKYGYNRVIHWGRDDSKNLIEVDDTPGAERIHIYHTSGSFIEMYPDGKIVIKAKENQHEIVEGDKWEHVEGTSKLIIEGDMSTEIKGNYNLKVGGSWNIDVGGTISESAQQHTMSKK